MSKKNWSNILSVLARTTLACVFVFGQTAWAGQSQNTKDKPTSDAVAKAQQTPPNSSTRSSKAKPAEEQTAVPENSSAKEDSRHGGQHEGITVHGHWSIEVHNPDGSLVRHLEFENSLDPGFTVSNLTPPIIAPGGASYLSALLTGQWTAPGAPTFWAILLVGPSGLNNLSPPPPSSPCVTNAPALGVCSIEQPVATCTSNAGPGISCNLSATALGNIPFFTGIQLSGSVAATQNGQISTVATVIGGINCPPSVSNCQFNSFLASFTSSTNFPGAPISVSAGQTIAVTVTISFS
jgi:hypothetical protein